VNQANAKDMAHGDATGAARFILGARIWGVVSGPVSLFLIIRFLQPVEQGFFYTFSSLVALSALFELGLGQVLVIFAGHESIGLTREAGQWTWADARRQARLGRLLRSGVAWTACASLGLALLLIMMGWRMFSRDAHAHQVEWRYPWLVLVLSSAVALAVGPVFAILEGIGENIAVYRIRLIAGVLGSLAGWTAFLLGAGLAAAAIIPTVQVATGLLWLIVRYRRLIAELMRSGGQGDLHWRQEVWPLQWRFALSWLAGYVIFQAATPAIFSLVGPVDAGRLGMAMTLVWALIGVGTSWVNAAVPRFSALAASSDRRAMDALLRYSLLRGFTLVVLGVLGILGVVACLIWVGNPVAQRFLPFPLLAAVLWTAIAHTVISSLAVYLRAHRREPMLALNLIEMPVMMLALWWGIKGFGVTGAVLAYVSVHGVGALFAAIAVFCHCRTHFFPKAPIVAAVERPC
jgi:O-antigen/teichoic acid export membrane protein